MKQHHFVVSIDFNDPEILISGEVARQMKKVLRLQIGEEVVLLDGQGKEAVAEILEYKKENVRLKVKSVRENKQDGRQVVLYVAILKKDNFEWVVQKATEVGVSKIVPIITERTIKTGLKLERLQKIILEASEQSGQTVLPKLGEVVDFKEAIKNSVGKKLLFNMGGEKLTALDKKEKVYSIFIGPEGGWTDKEVALAKENDCQVVSLGESVLRGETAAVVAAWWAVNL